MRAINHIEFLCVYYHGGVCQQDNGGGIYVAQPRKLRRRRCVCGTRRKAKKATRIDGMSGVNKLDFSFFFVIGDGQKTTRHAHSREFHKKFTHKAKS
jgi:hypothetical protein